MLDPKDQPKVPVMSFPPRPKNLYLVYGYKVGVPERNIVLFEKGEDAMNLGISLTVSADGQKFFVGWHLGTVEATDGQDYVESSVPGPLAAVDLGEKMAALGIKTKDNPMLYMVVG
jgi:hypothetical protein